MVTVNRNLAALKARGIAQANGIAGQVRAAFITQIPGQEMLYMAKETEARAYLADPSPDMANYPLISAEVGVTAPTALEVAQVYLNLSVLWRGVAAQLETGRLGTINAIEAATSQTQITAAVGALAAAVQAMLP